MTDTPSLHRNQGVTAPEGFRAAGIAAGIKASGKPDLALVPFQPEPPMIRQVAVPRA